MSESDTTTPAQQTLVTHRCQCPGAGFCTTFQKYMGGRQVEICSGDCPPERPCGDGYRHALIARWYARKVGAVVDSKQVVVREQRSNPPVRITGVGGGRGLGDLVESALDTVGITKERVEKWVGGECGCRERKEKLNALGSWARRMFTGKIEKAKEYLEGLLDTGTANEGGHVKRGISWAYGVTTVPERRETLLPRTLASLAAAGFDAPRLFVDGADYSQTVWYQERFNTLQITTRFPKVRAYGNWVLALWELLIRNPAADRFALFQDDFVTYKNLRGYLDRCIYPEKGYWNLLTFMENDALIKDREVGWAESAELSGRSRGGKVYHGKMQQGGRGAVGLAFDRTTVQTLLAHRNLPDRPTSVAEGHRRIDGAVVQALNQCGWREYIHNPSLVQHTGEITSIRGNRRHPRALSFRGEDFDALSLLPAPIIAETPNPVVN